MDIQRPISNTPTPTTPSLYQQTMSTIQNLYSLTDFELYLFPEGLDTLMEATDGNPVIDPVAVLWGCFRLGAPLCHLMNHVKDLKKPLDVPDVLGLAIYNNTCKKCIYHFLIACKEELGMQDSELFSISELYKDDTNGFIKTLNTVNKVLVEIQKRNGPIALKSLPFQQTKDKELPLDHRTQILNELLTTERKYIQDLQSLKAYQDDLYSKNTGKELLMQIFSNLLEVLDFQRRFLIAMEATLALHPDEQRIGLLFSSNETAFSIYEIICGNYHKAIQVASARANELLSKSELMDPIRSLPSYLIKPVQRICKYPLLLGELIKHTNPSTYPYLQELKAGLEAVKRITDNINEQTRRDENRLVKAQLVEWVGDWKGFDIQKTGDLILHDKFNMTTPDGDKEYHVFLFENVLLCCKDTGKKNKKKNIPIYALRGNIYIPSIVEVSNSSKPNDLLFSLRIYWKDVADMESFTLKCRNDEQVSLWKIRIERLLEGKRLSRQSPNSFYESKGLRFSLTDLESVKSWDDKDSQRDSLRDSVRDSLWHSHTSSGLHSSMESKSPRHNRTISFGQESPQPRSASLYPSRSKRSGTTSSSGSILTGESDNGDQDRWSFLSTRSQAPTSALPGPPSISSTIPLPHLNVSDAKAPPPSDPLPLPPNSFYTPIDSNADPLYSRASQESILDSLSKVQIASLLEKRSSQMTSVSSIESGGSSSFIKLKIFYGTDIFAITLPTNRCSFAELVIKIERKIRLCGAALPTDRPLRIKYKDEDEDLIQIHTDEDVEMALEMVRSNYSDNRGIVYIYVE